MESFESRKNKIEKAMSSQEDLVKPGKDEEDEKQYSIRFLILDYFEYTSGHGPPRILASKQLIRKIFWTLLFLTALALSSWQISILFETYKQRPLTTHVSIQHETVSNFVYLAFQEFMKMDKKGTRTVITFCNMRASVMKVSG